MIKPTSINEVINMYIKEETKRNIESIVGKPLDEIQSMTLDEEIAHVESRTGKKLEFSKDVDWRFVSTGNPLISLGRCRTMEDVDKRFDQMFRKELFVLKIKQIWRGAVKCLNLY